MTTKQIGVWTCTACGASNNYPEDDYCTCCHHVFDAVDEEHADIIEIEEEECDD